MLDGLNGPPWFPDELNPVDGETDRTCPEGFRSVIFIPVAFCPDVRVIGLLSYWPAGSIEVS